MDLVLLTFLTAFGVVLLSTPSLIKVAILKRLFDEPSEERKLHKKVVPTVGGIIIFAGTFFSFVLWFPSDTLLDIDVGDSNYLKNALNLQATKSALNDFKYILATVFVIFFVGAKDDIIGTAPIKRLAAHILAAMMIVLMANIRLRSMHGIFGIDEIPFWASIFISIFATIVIINAFNFIDGVDGLAAGIGFLAAFAFGVWFYLAKDMVMSLLAFGLAGSLMAFLIYNFSPASLFMGDSGSTTIGLLMAVLSLKAIETPNAEVSSTIISDVHRPVFVLALLSYPLVDTLRIFIYRTIRGLSPFEADRNHIHHAMLDLGLSHRLTSLILYTATLSVVAVSFYAREAGTTYGFLVTLIYAVVLAQVPFILKIARRSKLKKEVENTSNGSALVSKEVKKRLIEEKDF